MTKKINTMIRLIIERERLRQGRKEGLSVEGSLEMDRRDVTALLISYTPMQNKKLKNKKDRFLGTELTRH